MIARFIGLARIIRVATGMGSLWIMELTSFIKLGRPMGQAWFMRLTRFMRLRETSGFPDCVGD